MRAGKVEMANRTVQPLTPADERLFLELIGKSNSYTTGDRAALNQLMEDLREQLRRGADDASLSSQKLAWMLSYTTHQSLC